MILTKGGYMSTAAVIEREIEPQAYRPEGQTPVFVIFTSVDQTMKALEKANQLAKMRQTGIEILAVQNVPYPLPLDEPRVSTEFVVRRLEEMADHFPEKTRISAYLCRDPMDALKQVLNENCPVVMGVKKTRRPTREKKLAQKLHSAGFDVILAETE
jgi:hypothetical protein